MIVQDLFKNVDMNKLSQAFSKCSFNLERKYKEMGEQKFTNLIQNTVNELLSISPTLSDDYICVIEQFDDSEVKNQYEVIYEPSIIEKETLLKNYEYIKRQVEEYNLELFKENPLVSGSLFLLPREEILGYQFSEYSLQNFNKYDVIASILFELTWFGYDNKTSEENIEKETQILLDRAKEVKEHPENLIPFDKAMHDVFGDLWDEIEKEIEPPTDEEINHLIKINSEPKLKDYLFILENYLKEDIEKIYKY